VKTLGTLFFSSWNGDFETYWRRGQWFSIVSSSAPRS